MVTAIPTGAHADDYSDVNRLVTARKLGEALAKADAYLAGKPRDPQMRFIKGVIHSDMGQSAQAMVIFRQLNQDYPELPEPYNNLAVLEAAAGRLDAARAALETALRLNPGYATAQQNLGDVYARLAGRAWARALELDPANPALQPRLQILQQLPTTGAARPKSPFSASPSSGSTRWWFATRCSHRSPPATSTVGR